MRKSWTLRAVVGIGIAFACTVVFTAQPAAEARPQYARQFILKYPDLRQASAEVKHCGVCHGGEDGADKETHNDYGSALMSTLTDANVTDVDAIVAALDKIAKQPSSVDGKTFGDLIAEGTLPGNTVAASE